MKFKTLQIVWHDKQPVFSTEFLSNDAFMTCGGDKAIRVNCQKDGSLGVQLESEIAGMNGTVNCIRLSPKGDEFATGGDSGEVMIWKKNPDFGQDQDAGSNQTKPWKPASFLRGHANDVLDMCWSSDGSALATASLEGVTIVWDVQRERAKVRLCDHHHYVQGVAWDPFNRFLITQGGDRRCKVYTRPVESHAKKDAACKTAMHCHVPVLEIMIKHHLAEEGDASEKASTQKDFLFADDTLPSFFRRLEWSPDGSFLIVPAGLRNSDGANSSTCPVAFLYCRGKWSSPAACLGGAGEPFVVARCCPVFFERNIHADENSLSELPYSVVFACATLHNVLIYNSTNPTPVAFLCGLHYSEITDMAWSPDGAYLMISSRDGYCSIVHFEPGDLGVPLNLPFLVSSDTAVSDWFCALEEIQNRVDSLPVKRHIQAQKVAAVTGEEESTEAAALPAAKRDVEKKDKHLMQPSVKRRITPVAVQSVQVEEAPVKPKEPETKPPQLFSSARAFRNDLFCDLHKLAGSTKQPVKSEEIQKKPAMIDLLAMSRNYASNRFSQNDGGDDGNSSSKNSKNKAD